MEKNRQIYLTITLTYNKHSLINMCPLVAVRLDFTFSRVFLIPECVYMFLIPECVYIYITRTFFFFTRINSLLLFSRLFMNLSSPLVLPLRTLLLFYFFFIIFRFSFQKLHNSFSIIRFSSPALLTIILNSLLWFSHPLLSCYRFLFALSLLLFLFCNRRPLPP